MLRAKRLLISFATFHEQSCALLSASVCIVRRGFCFSSGGFDDKMSGKSLPKWIKPEGDGELKLYNSLTREKVICCYFRPVNYFFQVISLQKKFYVCLMQHMTSLLKPANQINIRLILLPSLVIIQSTSLLCLFPTLIYSE